MRVVPLDDSPTLTELVPAGQIATAALVELGIYNVDQASQPMEIVTPTEIATLAIKELLVLNLDFPPLTEVVLNTTIATAALVELGVIASDEAASPSDEALAVDKVALVHGALVAKGIARWNLDNIPRGFTEEYTKLTAAWAASSFGKTVDPAIVALLEGRIQAGVIVLTNDLAFMGDLVTYVHNSLIAHGIAPWSINQIPRAFAEEYTKLTVAYAAASFGKQADPALIAPLEERIRQGSMVMTVDQAFLLGKVASVHAALDAQGVVWWTGDAIPRAFVEEYVKLTVANAAASLGKQIDPKMIPVLEARVRKGAMVLSADDIATDAVQAVHDDLAMRGLVRWSSQDIPDVVGEQYVMLAADRLAPLFETRTDPRDALAAMAALRRYIVLPSSGETTPAMYF